MDQLTVALPAALKSWAEAVVAEGRYADTGDLVRDLLRREQDHAGRLARLQDAIDAGLASPPTDATIESIIAESRAGLA